MNLYLDTEYNGFGGGLISMALVADDGAEWYQVRMTPPFGATNQWVAENVIPVLGEKPVGNEAFLSSFHTFIKGYAGACVVADWPEDLVHFFSCLNGNDYGSSLRLPIMAEFIPETDCHPETPHNALSDARALRDWYRANRR